MTPWKISADTGGTFTDCHGTPPDGPPRSVKVLSSGRLRVAIARWLDDGRAARLTIPNEWHAPDAFFTGFHAESGGKIARVAAWDADSQVLRFASAFPATASALDLFTGEEAPVLGARLITGAAVGRDFPPIDFRLGTTRGTNALLERKGAPVVLFITRGFGDLPVIRDQRRPDLFALHHRRPQPLHARVVEVDERLAADGTTILPLSASFEAAARDALASGIRVAAVALLHSYQNPTHERDLRGRLVTLGFEHVSLSSDLAPFIKLLPRTETAIVDATLTPVLRQFLDTIQRDIGAGSRLLVMTSAGGLEPAARFRPKDSLLSGPAGGVVGAAAAARALGFEKIITFDMGGTSTDVARVDGGHYHYRFEQRVGDARLLAPALRIETVASGGGSICQWTPAGLRVGPESAGADPGPACYGRGGPLTITDVNLLLGRIDPGQFGIPIGPENLAAARAALANLQARIPEPAPGERDLLEGLAAIATEQMADAIRTISLREGVDPAGYALLAFGGAGPLHACDIAERLAIGTILVPREAGLLSACGIHHAAIERFAERQILQPLAGFHGEKLAAERESLAAEAIGRVGENARVHRQLAELRLSGQDATLSIEIDAPDRLADDFRQKYESIFGYPPDPARPIELVALRVIAASAQPEPAFRSNPVTSAIQPCPVSDPTLFHRRASLAPGTVLAGPAVIQDPFCTTFLKNGWSATVAENGTLILRPTGGERPAALHSAPTILRELFRHRFANVVGEMGAMLQRSAISTNVKEREDYSCALLDAAGELVVNAPHIPVHLGALGLCVRDTIRAIDWQPGDTIITNHPAFGGSHLPDVTLMTPVFADTGELLGFVANRAHHAEIGGIAPGSMPPDAHSLAEEGVVIPPRHLVRRDGARFHEIERLLTLDTPHPTRRIADNLADLHAQVAANRRGADLLQKMAAEHGAGAIREHLETLAGQARDSLRAHLDATGFTGGAAVETLDDGTEIHARLTRGAGDGRLTIDFTGTSESHPGNLNATPAIVRSAILYTLRLWTQSPMPLNEGLLREVAIVLPRCFLNPDFPTDPAQCPAVVGGNVETSQRIVNLLIRILGFQAGSQGTMNNFIFGNERFGYYETIGGGAGAGPDHDGAGGLHTHMTNTAITDPEILERRYPVRLRAFSLRRGSGGAGRHRGGDGLVREIEFLEPLRVSLLTQHRNTGPNGMAGGENGAPGRQTLMRLSGGSAETLASQAAFDAAAGDVLRIETPGGGGFGASG